MACTQPSPEPPQPEPVTAPTRQPTREAVDPIDPTAAGGGTLRYGLREPESIVPAGAVTAEELVVVDALFDSLTTYDARLSVIPSAAVSWAADEEQREWTFTLREGARFHPHPDRAAQPGPPVTAADFKHGWELAVAGGESGFHLDLVEGYEELATGAAAELTGVVAVDERTLLVRLREPQANFPAVVAHPALGPVPAALWQADEVGYVEQPVGNGPFRAAEALVRGQFLRVQRFGDWANGLGPAALDEVLFQFSDTDTAYVAFQQGRREVSPIPTGAVDQAIEQFGLSDDGYRGSGVLRGETPTLYFLGFNVTQPPYDDPEIRRALSLAIDRDALAEELDTNVTPARSLVSPSIPNGRDEVCSACEHDPDAAREIFEERDVQRLRLWFNRDGGHVPVARQIRQDLADVGVVLELQAQAPDLASYLDELASGDAGLFRFGWTPEYPTFDEVLYPLFHSTSIGERNYMRYAREDVDDLLDRARRSSGALLRVYLSRRAEDLILDRDQAAVPLFFYMHEIVVSDRVEGFRTDAFGRVNLAEVTLATAD